MDSQEFIEQPMSDLYAKCGAFFAFSDEQFNASKKEGVTYVNAGYGLLCPKENAETLKTELPIILEEGAKKRLEKYGIDALIEYELGNHECYYTGEISDAFMGLHPSYNVTMDDIRRVYRATAHKYD